MATGWHDCPKWAAQLAWACADELRSAHCGLWPLTRPTIERCADRQRLTIQWRSRHAAAGALMDAIIIASGPHPERVAIHELAEHMLLSGRVPGCPPGEYHNIARMVDELWSHIQQAVTAAEAQFAPAVRQPLAVSLPVDV